MTSLTLAAAIAAMIVAPVPAQPTGTPTSAKVDVPFDAITSQPGPAEPEGTIIHAPAGHFGVGIAQDPTSAGIPHPSADGGGPGQGGG